MKLLEYETLISLWSKFYLQEIVGWLGEKSSWSGI